MNAAAEIKKFLDGLDDVAVFQLNNYLQIFEHITFINDTITVNETTINFLDFVNFLVLSNPLSGFFGHLSLQT